MSHKTFLIVVSCLLAGAMGYAVAQEEPPWAQAYSPRSWVFPRDHGAHPEYRTEWWYFVGNLRNGAEERFGYQLTFFRQGIRQEAPNPANPWSLRDLYFAHFALTDVSSGRFLYADKVSRAGPGLAGARTDGMAVWLLNWWAEMKDSAIVLGASTSAMALQLELTPKKPVVLHGEKGLSRKGLAEGQASYYVSFTDLKTRGSLRTHPGGPLQGVYGTSWHDHEFGSNQLSPEQEGWDWFSLHLSDGRDLMIYFLRRKDASVEPVSSGTLVAPNGEARHLKLSEIDVATLDHWQSPHSRTKYPSRWRIRVPTAEIDVIISPLLADQELHTQASTGITYWEGAVAGKGSSWDREVSCEGYVELAGYAGSLGGVF